MKKTFLMILAIALFSAQCKGQVNYWNPLGEFPLLMETGKSSKDAKDSFSLQTVPDEFNMLLINFFAPDCKPCIIEVPEFKKIHKTIQEKKNIKFVAIGSRLSSLSADNITDADVIAPEILQFKQAYKMDYPVHLARTSELKDYGLTGFPETFILVRNEKRQWIVKRRFLGMITEKDVNPFLK